MKTISLEDPKNIEESVKCLNNGKLVIFPSETCYGVAVDATNHTAVTKLLEYKKRPEGRAIPIAVLNKEMAEEYVELNSVAQNLYKKFLPGAVTIVSNSKNKVDSRLESESHTLGVRIPNFKFLLDLISRFGKPITVTSANLTGKKTPYTVNDILNNISEKQRDLIDLVIDAGELPHNPPTTVIDTTSEDLKVHREGRIDPTKVTEFETYVSNSVEETISQGEIFIKNKLPELTSSPILILLNGELGAGKTQFTKGTAKGLGIDRVIKSPTYNYVNEYKFGENHKLFHMDAWRIQTKEDLDLLRFEEWVKPGNIIAVEWPSVVMNLDEKFFEKIQYYYADFIIKDKQAREIRVYKILKA